MSKLQPSGIGSFPSPLLLKLFLPALVAVVTTLAGCGGGGGSSSGNPTPSGSGSAPVASSGTVSGTEDVAFSNTLSATDADGNALTYTIVTNGTKGTAVISDAASGAYTYTPNANANGTDSFTFKANDGTKDSKDSNVATITITLAPVADTPVASASSVLTNQDTPATGTLIASDADGDALTYSIITNGTKGSAALTNASTGAFTYTPNASVVGSDSFTFRVNDGARNSNTATVTLTINAAPVAADGCNYTPQPASDGALPDFTGTLVATDPDSSQFTYQLAGGGTGPFITAKGGTVNITDPTTGAFSYKPRSLAADMSDGTTVASRGQDSFSFQAVDTNGAIGNAVQSVIVDQTIMPLGDSITVGDTDPPATPTTTTATVGYRRWLNDQLVTAGIGFDLVGTQRNGENFLPAVDIDHEGHGGWKASEIVDGSGPGGNPSVDGIYNWLNTNPSDFVLLHIGTNGLTASSSGADVSPILDAIDQWELDTGKHVTVLLALIIDWAGSNPSGNNPDVTSFNQSVKTMAQNRIAAGDDIVIVNQQTGAGLDYRLPANGGVDMASELHPSDTGGYPKMATLWVNTLKGVMDQCP